MFYFKKIQKDSPVFRSIIFEAYGVPYMVLNI